MPSKNHAVAHCRRPGFISLCNAHPSHLRLSAPGSQLLPTNMDTAVDARAKARERAKARAAAAKAGGAEGAPARAVARAVAKPAGEGGEPAAAAGGGGAAAARARARGDAVPSCYQCHSLPRSCSLPSSCCSTVKSRDRL